MKTIKTLLVLTVLLTGSVLRSSSQIILPEVRIAASTYKYLNAIDNKEMSQPVKMLEFKAASYDIKKSEFYNDDYDNYYVTFYIPNGTILAAYDKDGKLLRTAEKFKNTQLPAVIRNAVEQRFPKWRIMQDIYQVYYYDQNETATKTFRFLLENSGKRMNVNLNEKGEFVENIWTTIFNSARVFDPWFVH